MTIAELFHTFRSFRPWLLLWLAVGLPMALMLGDTASEPGLLGSARFWLCDAPFTLLLFSVVGSFVRAEPGYERVKQTATA